MLPVQTNATRNGAGRGCPSFWPGRAAGEAPRQARQHRPPSRPILWTVHRSADSVGGAPPSRPESPHGPVPDHTDTLGADCRAAHPARREPRCARCIPVSTASPTRLIGARATDDYRAGAAGLVEDVARLVRLIQLCDDDLAAAQRAETSCASWGAPDGPTTSTSAAAGSSPSTPTTYAPRRGTCARAPPRAMRSGRPCNVRSAGTRGCLALSARRVGDGCRGGAAARRGSRHDGRHLRVRGTARQARSPRRPATTLAGELARMAALLRTTPGSRPGRSGTSSPGTAPTGSRSGPVRRHDRSAAGTRGSSGRSPG
jgi:hypothetical protein